MSIWLRTEEERSGEKIEETGPREERGEEEEELPGDPEKSQLPKPTNPLKLPPPDRFVNLSSILGYNLPIILSITKIKHLSYKS